MSIDIDSPEGQRHFEAIGHEVGAIFDREKLPEALASAILLDLWARIAALSANNSEDARKTLVAAGAQLLDQLSGHYARGGT